MFKSLDSISGTFKIKFSDIYIPYTQDIIRIFNGDDIFTDHPLLWNVMGLYHKYVLNDISSARKYFGKAARAKCPDAMNNLGMIYRDEGKISEAKTMFHDSTHLGSDVGINLLARMYEREGNYVLAIRYYLDGIASGFDSSANLLGMLYLNLGDYPNAEKYFKMGIDFGNVYCIVNLAKVYHLQEKIDLAVDYNLRGAQLNFQPCFLNLGILYEQMGKIKEAEKYYLQGGDGPRAIAHLILFYSKLDKVRSAGRYVDEALARGILDKVMGFIKKEINYLRIYYLAENKDKLMTWFVSQKINTDPINIFINKINMVTIQRECGICSESTCILTECCHYLCASCYTKVNECPICRIKMRSFE